MGIQNLLNKWVMLTWLDSAGPTSRWEYREDIEQDHVARCTTVGYCTHIDHESIELAQTVAHESQGEDEQVTGRMTIPICAIVNHWEIEDS